MGLVREDEDRSQGFVSNSLSSSHEASTLKNSRKTEEGPVEFHSQCGQGPQGSHDERRVGNFDDIFCKNQIN